MKKKPEQMSWSEIEEKIKNMKSETWQEMYREWLKEQEAKKKNKKP